MAVEVMAAGKVEAAVVAGMVAAAIEGVVAVAEVTVAAATEEVVTEQPSVEALCGRAAAVVPTPAEPCYNHNVRGAIVGECHALLQHVWRDRARGKCTSRVLTVVLHPAIASGASQGH